MFDTKALEEMEKYLKEEDSQREELIAKSRIILKNSKATIYSIHRHELDKAKELLDEARKVIKNVKPIVEKHPHLKHTLDNALEEYCEAECFYVFVKEKRVPTFKDLEVDPIVYLGGLSDLTGELGRRSVLQAIAKNKKEVQEIREVVDEIYGAFTRFDLRNGDLRKKADSIKWNLQKVEELLHDLTKKE